MSKFVHMELNTSDVEGAKEFYGGVFGWTFEDMQMPDGVYAMVEGVGGIQHNPMADAPSHWLGYVGVESIDDTIDTVERLGGKIVMPETEVPGMGSLAVFVDPQGAVCAIWQPAAMPEIEPATEKPAAKKKAGKKAAKKAAKKAPAKKAPAKKKTAEKAPAKKAPAKKAPAKKKTAKKAPAAKKQTAKKAPAKKKTAKKAPASKKKAGKKKPAKKK